MTQNLPPQLEGHIKPPSALELLWEKHRNKVNALLLVLVVAMLASYGYGFWRQSRINSLWSGIAQASKLDEGYTTEGSMAQLAAQIGQQSPEIINWVIGSTKNELVTRYADQLKNASKKDLDDALAKVRGHQFEPLMLWVITYRALVLDELDTARSILKDLQARFPNHFLCQTTSYPVQWRYDRNVDKEKPKGADAARPKKDETPDLVAPVRGSSVSLLLEEIDKAEAFRKSNDRFFKVPEPDGSTYLIKTSSGDIQVKLYKTLAPKHCENFQQRVAEQFFDSMQVDEIHRATKAGFMASDNSQEFRFGLPSSKDSDRTKWTNEPSKVKVEWENSDLSHFAGMVAAEKDTDNKTSSGERVWITANDCYAQDGDRVIFGRVTQGLDVVKQIVQEQFATQQEATAGRGKPSRSIRIESVREVK